MDAKFIVIAYDPHLQKYVTSYAAKDMREANFAAALFQQCYEDLGICTYVFKLMEI